MKFFTLLIIFLLSNGLSLADQKKILHPHSGIKETVKAELQAGRWELVMFWATYCPICKKDFVKIAEFIEDYPQIPLTIVGVIVDGIDQQEKAHMLINRRKLNYTHLITDYQHASAFFKEIAESELIGVPSYLLYNPENEMVGYNHNAIDIEALALFLDE